MPKYKVTAYATVEIVTEVEAENEEEAKQLAADRDVDICIHGSEFATGELDAEEFTLADGAVEGFEIDEIEEL